MKKYAKKWHISSWNRSTWRKKLRRSSATWPIVATSHAWKPFKSSTSAASNHFPRLSSVRVCSTTLEIHYIIQIRQTYSSPGMMLTWIVRSATVSGWDWSCQLTLSSQDFYSAGTQWLTGLALKRKSCSRDCWGLISIWNRRTST